MTADSASGQSRTWQTGAFAAIALGLGTMSWIAGNGPLAPHTRHVMTMALSFDLLVTLPGSYYLLVARPRGQRWWTVVGVAVLGMLRTAMLVAPAALARLILGAAIEAGLMGVLVIRARTAWRARGRHDDPLVVLGRIMPETSLPLAAAIVSSELAVFDYSLLSWGRRPHVPAGLRPFSVHQRGGATAILYVMAAMGLLETAVVHIVVQHWSARTRAATDSGRRRHHRVPGQLVVDGGRGPHECGGSPAVHRDSREARINGPPLARLVYHAVGLSTLPRAGDRHRPVGPEENSRCSRRAD